MNKLIIKLKAVFLLFLCLLVPQIGYAATEKKQLYIGTGPGLTRTEPAADIKTGKIEENSSVVLDQTIEFQSAFTILAGIIDIDLAIERDSKGDSNRSVKLELFKVSAGGAETAIGSVTQLIDIAIPNANGTELKSFQFNVATVNFIANDFIRLRVTHLDSDGDKENIRVHSNKNGVSMIVMQTDTFINVDSIDVYGNPAPVLTPLYLSYTQGNTVYIRATVSDPFGVEDIRIADINVYDTTGALDLQAASLTALLDPAASGATAYFETPYTIPNVDGIYTIEVTAYEGTENDVTHTLQQIFHVGSPSLTVKKSSSTVYDPVNLNILPKAIPGSHIQFTVETTNSGYGYADNNTVIITDPLAGAKTTFYFGSTSPPYNPVVFSDGDTFGNLASGLNYTFIDLTSTVDDVDFYSDATCTTPVLSPAVDGNGYDISSPKIVCISINPKGDFKGSEDLVNFPAFRVDFTVRVD